MKRPTAEELTGLRAILERVKRIEESELGADDPVIRAIPWLEDVLQTADEPDPLSEALNSGDGSYRP